MTSPADDDDATRATGSVLRAMARLVLSAAIPVLAIGGALWFIVSSDRLDRSIEHQAIANSRLAQILVGDDVARATDRVGVDVVDAAAIDARVETIVEPLLGPVEVTIIDADGTVAYPAAVAGSDAGLTDLDRRALAGVPVGEEQPAIGERHPVLYALPVAPADGSTAGVVRLAVADDVVVGQTASDVQRLRVLFGAAFLALLLALVPICWLSLGRLGKNLRQTRRLATSDSLTGLANRGHFHERLEEAVAAAARGRSKVGLVMLDLDGFKAINDTGGHAAGDRLLKRVAATLQSGTRRNETVCRLGGDEFAVILPRPDSREDLTNLAERLHKDLDISVDFSDGRSLRVTASIGLALFPDDATSGDDLVNVADMAMYKVKAARAAKLPKGRRNLVR